VLIGAVEILEALLGVAQSDSVFDRRTGRRKSGPSSLTLNRSVSPSRSARIEM
jgi:hypothetical protein